MRSKLFSLKTKDFIKGSIVAILTGIGTILASELQTGTITFKKVWMACLIAFIAYLTKNLFTNHNDEFLNIK